ncbi:EamA family transporter [Taibaiella sp. KBW10]|uniref:EamA family transporter n=1 Tax=Taibaiella sp. KBW10 TaxID=2153357 RepID=UPI000F592A7D|nr:DMT family transporter [Taibaiella sp. KBW10]RQO32224.1 EamA family transporter [Taibaiella sp. KBW10]
MKTNLKGVVLVLLGAISYGILATIVKYANHKGIPVSVLTFLQSLIGVLFLMAYAYAKQKKQAHHLPLTHRARLKLLLFGTSLGITSSLYYLSIQYIPVSLGIVLLMQSIWMSLLLEYILYRKPIGKLKIIGALTTIAGTILATNILFQETALAWKGIALGLGAALSYTISLYASSTIEKTQPSHIRSLYLVSGSLLAVMMFWNSAIISDFTTLRALPWGLLLAVFGTILPPLLFTKGIPMIGIGLGGILIAVEIPVSVLSAHLVLGEHVALMQWTGIGLILFSVIMVNKPKTK